MTLENMLDKNEEPSKEPEEDNQELNDLLKFKQGLSEQELIELEVD